MTWAVAEKEKANWQSAKLMETPLLCNFTFHRDSIKPYIIPVVQPRQEDASSSVNMFALSDDHVSGWSQ